MEQLQGGSVPISGVLGPQLRRGGGRQGLRAFPFLKRRGRPRLDPGAAVATGSLLRKEGGKSRPPGALRSDIPLGVKLMRRRLLTTWKNEYNLL